MDVNSISGGMDTTRIPATAGSDGRAERDAAALRYLAWRGCDDIAVILGLDDDAAPTRSRAVVRRRLDARSCTVCGTEFRPFKLDQQTCSRKCGRSLRDRPGGGS